MSRIEEIRNMKNPVQQELFSKEKKEKEFDALTAKVVRYAEARKEKLMYTGEKNSQSVIEKKEIAISEKSYKIIWSVGMPISGDRDQYNDSIDDHVSLGDDGIWRIEKKDVISEERVIEYIKHYFVEKKAQELIEEIKQCKKDNKL